MLTILAYAQDNDINIKISGAIPSPDGSKQDAEFSTTFDAGSFGSNRDADGNSNAIQDAFSKLLKPQNEDAQYIDELTPKPSVEELEAASKALTQLNSEAKRDELDAKSANDEAVKTLKQLGDLGDKAERNAANEASLKAKYNEAAGVYNQNALAKKNLDGVQKASTEMEAFLQAGDTDEEQGENGIQTGVQDIHGLASEVDDIIEAHVGEQEASMHSLMAWDEELTTSMNALVTQLLSLNETMNGISTGLDRSLEEIGKLNNDLAARVADQKFQPLTDAPADGSLLQVAQKTSGHLLAAHPTYHSWSLNEKLVLLFQNAHKHLATIPGKEETCKVFKKAAAGLGRAVASAEDDLEVRLHKFKNIISKMETLPQLPIMTHA